MGTISRIADIWMPLFLVHMVEISLFILLVWGIDHILKLNTRLRYTLWLLALVKVFVPPLFSSPTPVSELLPVQFTLQSVISNPHVAEETATFTPALLLLGVWAISIFILAGVVVGQNIALSRRLRNASSVALPAALVPSSKLRFQVLTAETIPAPVLVGFWKPRLYLPIDWEEWPNIHLRSILAHEMAHLQGRDLWVSALQTLTLALFGLNPLVWVMHKRLMHIRELLRDEAVIGETGIHPVDYSNFLFGFIQSQDRETFPLVTGTYFSENQLSIFGRFHHMLNFQEADMKARKRRHYVVLALLGLAILPFSCGKQGTETSGAPTAAKVAGGELLNVWQVEKPPTPINQVKQVKIEYPKEAKKDGLEGVVFLSLTVGADGKVYDVEVLKGPEVFRQSAVDAAKQMMFGPANHKGEPVAVRMQMPIRFALGKKGGNGSTSGSPQAK